MESVAAHPPVPRLLAGDDDLVARGASVSALANDVLTWANGTLDELKSMVLTKMNAAKGGGYIVQSDHSVPSNVSGERYEYVVNLVREYGQYPLRLGEYDLPDVK